MLAVNEARTERALNDRHGTGQSALDGIVRASNVLLAGHTVVVLGYGWAGQGVAERARGAGAAVIVCEVDPLRALEARMAGYEVMPALEAAERGDMFITVTGSRRVLRGEHFERMKDGALLANAGHFDVEIDLDELRALATGGVRAVRPLVEQYRLADGRRLNLLAHGRVVNLAAAEGHPAAVMDVSFALQALSVEQLVRSPRRAGARACTRCRPAIDREVGRLKLAALGRRRSTSRPPSRQDYRESWAVTAASSPRHPRVGLTSRMSRINGDLRGGIDLGGTKIEAIVVDADNKVLGQARRADADRGRPRGRRRADGRGDDGGGEGRRRRDRRS